MSNQETPAEQPVSAETSVETPAVFPEHDIVEIAPEFSLETTVAEAAADPVAKDDEVVMANKKTTPTDDEVVVPVDPNVFEWEEPVYVPMDKPFVFTGSESIVPVPFGTVAETNKRIEDLPYIDLTTTEEGDIWVNNLKLSSRSVPFRAWLEKLAKRKGSSFRQYVKSEVGKLRMVVPQFAEDNTMPLTGERGVLRVKQLWGQGSLIKIPLWHSGFWVTLKSPSEGALLELDRRLQEEKISMGRQTYGFLFSNASSFYTGWIMDFVVSHMYDCSLQQSKIGNIRKHISSLDIPVLAWGMACAIYPKGFVYAQSALTEDGEAIIKHERLDIRKMLCADTSTLTPWQVKHMSKRDGNTMSLENVARYREQFTIGGDREVKIDADTVLTLTVPDLNTYVNTGIAWINSMVAMVDRAFQLPPTDGDRDKFVTEQTKATIMRQYSHWVKGMRVKGFEVVGQETIENALAEASSDDTRRAKYLEEIQKFIEDNTMAVIGMPIISKGSDTVETPGFPDTLVLDPLSIFFTLLDQKATQIRERQE